MSTNISNGYRLAPGTSVLGLVRSLEETFFEARHSAIMRAMGELVMTLDEDKSEENRASYLNFITSNQVNLSRISLALDRSSTAIAKDVLFSLQDSLLRRNASRVPQLDVTLSIAFISDPKNLSDIYALVYAEQQEYVRVWESIEAVEEYFYWNSSDSQLKNMTRKEWKLRGKKWDEIIGDKGRPSFNSVSWDLDTMVIAFTKFDEGEIAASVAEAKIRKQQTAEWMKGIWGDENLFGLGSNIDPNDDDTEKMPQ